MFVQGDFTLIFQQNIHGGLPGNHYNNYLIFTALLYPTKKVTENIGQLLF